MTGSWDRLVRDYRATAVPVSEPPPIPLEASLAASGSKARRHLTVAVSALAVTLVAASVGVVSNSRSRGGLASPSSSPSAADAFPTIEYPPAASFPEWGSPGGCPSVAGLVKPDPMTATGASLNTINGRGGTAASNKAASDRAYWPVVEAAFQGQESVTPSPDLERANVSGSPAQGTVNAPLIAHNCGSQVLAYTWAVSDSPSTSPALSTTFYLINRNGSYLIWMTNP